MSASVVMHVPTPCSLVVGDVAGNFKQLFTRIESILKKSGPFEVCIRPVIVVGMVLKRLYVVSDAAVCWIILWGVRAEQSTVAELCGGQGEGYIQYMHNLCSSISTYGMTVCC